MKAKPSTVGMGGTRGRVRPTGLGMRPTAEGARFAEAPGFDVEASGCEGRAIGCEPRALGLEAGTGIRDEEVAGCDEVALTKEPAALAFEVHAPTCEVGALTSQVHAHRFPRFVPSPCRVGRANPRKERSNCLEHQVAGASSSHFRLVRHMVFKMTSNFLMHAVNATFLGFPLALNRS